MVIPTSADVGSIAWKSLTGQRVIQAEVATPESLSGRFDLDQSHMPKDEADLSAADRMEREERAANKHLKSFYAAGTVFDSTVRSLGTMGSYYSLVQGVLGNTPAGWIAVVGGAGAALSISDAAFQVKTAALNRNTPAAIDGSFQMVASTGVMLTAMGLGRIPALVAVGAMIGKFGYGMYRAAKDEQEKEATQKADEERKAAAESKPVGTQPVQPPAVQAPSAVEKPAEAKQA